MAVTGSNFPSSTSALQKSALHSVFFFMERHSIDLNQHAFDLNEAPSNDSVVAGFSDTPAAPGEVRNPWLPKKGGWLELFCKMFGQDSLMVNVPIPELAAPGISSGVFNANHNRVQMDAMNGRDRTPGCEQGFRHSRGKRKSSETSWLSNADASQNGKCNTTGNGFPCDGSEVPSIFHIPCVPRPEQGDLHNGSSQKSGSCFETSQDLRACSTSGQSCSYPFHIQPDQGSSYLHSTEALENGFNLNAFSVPLLDLNLLPCPVSSVNFQPSLQQVNPLPNVYFQSLSHVTPQSVKFCQSFYSVNDLGKIPGGEKLKKQKRIRHFLKKGSEQRVRKDYNTASEGGNDLELINQEPSPADIVESEAQEPTIRVIASPDWLPEGWITELKTRRAGSTAGTRDKYYKDPVTGRRFRSKNEVMNYLLRGNICRHKLQLKSFEGLIPLLNGFQPKDTEQTFESPANDIDQLDCDIFPGKISVKREGEEETLHNSAILRNAFLPLDKGIVHNNYTSTPTSSYLRPKTEEKEIQQATCMPLFLEELGQTVPSSVMEKFDGGVPCCNFSESEAVVERHSIDDGRTKLISSFGINQISDIVDCNKCIVLTGHRCHHHHHHHHHNHQHQQQQQQHQQQQQQQQKVLRNKVNGKKFLKSTLKHERELLISLGRKLCQEFLTSSKITPARAYR